MLWLFRRRFHNFKPFDIYFQEFSGQISGDALKLARWSSNEQDTIQPRWPNTLHILFLISYLYLFCIIYLVIAKLQVLPYDILMVPLILNIQIQIYIIYSLPVLLDLHLYNVPDLLMNYKVCNKKKNKLHSYYEHVTSHNNIFFLFRRYYFFNWLFVFLSFFICY